MIYVDKDFFIKGIEKNKNKNKKIIEENNKFHENLADKWNKLNNKKKNLYKKDIILSKQNNKLKDEISLKEEEIKKCEYDSKLKKEKILLEKKKIKNDYKVSKQKKINNMELKLSELEKEKIEITNKIKINYLQDKFKINE